MSKRDYYDVWGVIKSASPEEIKVIKEQKQNLKKLAKLIMFYLTKSGEITTINLVTQLLKEQVEEEDFQILIFQVFFQIFLAQTLLMISLKVLEDLEEEEEEDIQITEEQI